MNGEYLRFKLFPDKQTAEDFAEVLKQNNIEYQIEEDALVFDPSYANNPLSKDYVILIKQSDFKLASYTYDEYFAEQLSEVPEDYYLYSFTDDELQEILAKPDEWGSFDYQLAKELLMQRGIEVSKEKTERMKAERYKEIAQPEGESVKNIVGYYIVSILFFPIGLIIGWVWGYSKKQLPDGYRVSAYNSSVQMHGRTIFLISIILFVLTVILRIVNVR
ncbi:MAG: hypothetical protein J7502_00710 [Flavisolibacter sp.]|nr:hypothetical protein [Flavisolibacter sp.]